MAAANNARQLLIKKGATDSDADKQANKDAKAGTWPNPLLLKARLLNDGGYNNEALALLSGKSNTDFPQVSDNLEFTYRLARIYDDLDRDDEAIKTYLVAIALGKNRQEYYASRAALQIGWIYEKQGKMKPSFITKNASIWMGTIIKIQLTKKQKPALPVAKVNNLLTFKKNFITAFHDSKTYYTELRHYRKGRNQFLRQAQHYYRRNRRRQKHSYGRTVAYSWRARRQYRIITKRYQVLYRRLFFPIVKKGNRKFHSHK